MANLAARYVALIVESTFGTTPGGSPTYIYGEVDEESMKPSFELMDREDITRYGKRKSVVGTKVSGGEISCALQGDEFCGRLIANAFGANSKTGSGPYVNALTETTDEANFKSFTVCVGRDQREHRYLGQSIDSISIGANVNEYVMLSATFTGAEEDSSGTSGPGSIGFALDAPANSDLHVNDAFHFAKAYVNFESKKSGSNYSEFIKSVELEILLNRDVDNSYGLAQTTCTRAPPPQQREIKGTIEFNRQIQKNLVADNEPFWNELLAGLLVDGSSAAPAISLRFESDTAGEHLELNIFKVQYEAPESTVSARDTQTMSISFYALYDETENAMANASWSTNDSTNIL